MIFVYPAITSEKVNQKVLPAICKILEKYYLLQIQEAFQNRQMQITTVWDSLKGSYGPLQLENLIDGSNKPLLLEGAYDDYYRDQVQKLRELVKDRDRVQSDLDQYNQLIKTGTDPNLSTIEYQARVAEAELSELKSEIRSLETEIQSIKQGSKEERDLAIKREERRAVSDETRAAAEKIKADDLVRSKASEKAEKMADLEKGHAQVKVELTNAVDYRPTMANIKIKVSYRGGPGLGPEKGKEVFGIKAKVSGSEDSYTDVAIGVKVVPIILKNFDNIYRVLVSDLFSSKFNYLYKLSWRLITRKVVSFWRGIVDQLGIPPSLGNVSKILTGRVKQSSGTDLYKDVLLSTKRIVDAGSYTSPSGSEWNKFASSIVILDTSDIDSNETDFFKEPRLVQKLYRLGWNSFCITDDTAEVATFCSTLEGGNCFKIQYQYIFSSLQLGDVYKDLDVLNKQVKPLFMSSKNMRTLLQSKVYEHVDKLLSKFS